MESSLENTRDPSNLEIRIGTEYLFRSTQIQNGPRTEPELDDHEDKRISNKRLDALRSARIRVGTILKTDNVSFLIGAGASLDLGGMSLSCIPLEVEKLLLEKANADSDKGRSWIDTFYQTVSAICGAQFTFENRSQEFGNLDSTDTENDLPIDEIDLNLEDYLSHLHMWLAALGDFSDEIHVRASDTSELRLDRSSLDNLIQGITSVLSLHLSGIASDGDEGLEVHRKFIKKILTRPLNLRRVNLFTLNYDVLLERGADAEGVILVDGFVGILKRVFRPECYDLDFYFPAQTTEGQVHRFDRAIHLYKLHGSINWHRTDQNWQNPYGLYATYFDEKGSDADVMIFPSPLKYGQALGLPYSELFRRFGNAIAQPQSVLFSIGYGFGDEHVNAQIRQALAIPSFTLVIVDPFPSSSFVQQLEQLDDERVWIFKCKFQFFVDKILPDLNSEEISSRVMRTFRSLVDVTENPKEGLDD